MESDSSVCAFCRLKLAAYTCPRCLARYCSLGCYKGEAHAACSEAFYRDEFERALRSKRATGEERARMLAMLQRLEDEHADADGAAAALAGEQPIDERLADLDLGDPADVERVWERLSAAERREFADAVASGAVLSLVGEWRPWWQPADAAPAAAAAGEGAAAEGVVAAALGVRLGGEQALPSLQTSHARAGIVELDAQKPGTAAAIPPLQALLGKAAPAWSVVYNLCDVLLAYCFVSRVCHGDVDDAPLATAQLLAQASPVLAHNAVHASVEAALRGARALVSTSPQLRGMLPHFGVALADTRTLLSSPSHVTTALTHLHAILESAKRQERAGAGGGGGGREGGGGGGGGGKQSNQPATKPTGPRSSSSVTEGTTDALPQQEGPSGPPPPRKGGSAAHAAAATADRTATNAFRKAVFLCSWWPWLQASGYVRTAAGGGGAEQVAIGVAVSADDVLRLLRAGVEKEEQTYWQEQQELRAAAAAAAKQRAAHPPSAISASSSPSKPLIQEL